MWLSRGRWVERLVACLLATAALWIRIQTSLKKVQKWRHNKQWSGQYTLARQKIYKELNKYKMWTLMEFWSSILYWLEHAPSFPRLVWQFCNYCMILFDCFGIKRYPNSDPVTIISKQTELQHKGIE